MIIFVISLKNAIDRRDYIHKQFSKLGLSYEFHDAVDVKSSSKDILSIFSINFFKSFYNRYPTLAEIGNAISHHLVRRKILQSNKKNTVMICEDDAKIICKKDDLISVVKLFEKSKFDLLVLGFSKCDDDFEKHINIINPVLPLFKVANKINIGPRFLHTTSGSVSYLIKKKSVEIISTISPQFALTDDWNYFSKLGLKIGYTNPMIVRENFKELPSYAEHHNSSQISYKSNIFFVNYILHCRKHVLGLLRLIILYLKYKIFNLHELEGLRNDNNL